MKDKGFTLLEVLISVAILGVIMVLLWSSTSQSLNTKDRVEARDDVFQQGRVALRKMTDDLAVAFLVRKGTTGTAHPAPESPPDEGVTEIEGPALKTFFIGEDSGDSDSVRFTSLSHLRLFKNAKESDQCRIAYELVASAENPRLFNLVRREEPWIAEDTEVKGKAFVLAEGISELNIEYYDGRKNEWGKEWDSEKVDWRLRLPQAVRISIAFSDPDDSDKDILMSTAVLLPLSTGPIEL